MTIADTIRSDIEGRIASGEWKPGFRIPFEHELVSQYGCARATVGKALTALVRAGLIERRRKAGSFVAHPHVHAAVLDIPDIGAAIAQRTGAYHFELVSSDVTASDNRSPDFAGATKLRRIVGIHHGRSGPFAFEDRTINLDAVPQARDADFSLEPPSTWLLGHVPWSEARHRISAIGASPDMARKLKVAKGTACLMVERWTWREGIPITFVCQTFPGDRFDLTANFAPGSRA